MGYVGEDYYRTASSPSAEKPLAAGAHHPKMLEQRSQAGAHRKAVNLAKLQITTALERESVWVAKMAMKLAQRHIPKLRALLGVDREFLELSEKLPPKKRSCLLVRL